MQRIFKLIIFLIIILTIQMNNQIQAQIEVVDEIRDAITDPNCEASCFLGIQPGITTVNEALAILEANNIEYERGDFTFSDLYSYYTIDYLWEVLPFSSIEDVNLTIVPVLDGDDFVGGITIRVDAITIEEALMIFPELPDKISDVFGPMLIYADKQVTFIATTIDYQVGEIQLNSLDEIEYRLDTLDDLQPCNEPEVICSIPTAAFPALESFTQFPADQPLSDDEMINLEPNLTIRANTTPETVGSVVFSDGTNTIVDNEAPYEFPITSAGSYTLTATPYTEADGGGTAGAPLTIEFTVSEP